MNDKILDLMLRTNRTLDVNLKLTTIEYLMKLFIDQYGIEPGIERFIIINQCN